MSLIQITSHDGIEFVLAKEIAQMSDVFAQQIKKAEYERGEGNIISDIKSDILEVILQYLHFKDRWQFSALETLPKFQIEPQKALLVLQAAIALKI